MRSQFSPLHLCAVFMYWGKVYRPFRKLFIYAITVKYFALLEESISSSYADEIYEAACLCFVMRLQLIVNLTAEALLNDHFCGHFTKTLKFDILQ